MSFAETKINGLDLKKELGFILKQIESFKNISDLYEILKLIGNRFSELNIASVVMVPDKRTVNLIVRYINKAGLDLNLPYKESDRIYLNNLKNYKKARELRKSIFFPNDKSYLKRMTGRDNSRLKEHVNSIISPLILRGEIVAYVELFSNELVQGDTSQINNFSRELVVRIANMILFCEVRRSEERYRNLFEKAKDGFYILNGRTKKFVDVNQGLCDMSGYTRIELLQMNVVMLFVASDRKRIEDYIEQRINQVVVKPKNTAPWNYETKLLTKTKKLRDVEINIMQFASSEEWFVSVRDITEKKKIKEELEVSNKKYQLLAENVSDLICVLDNNTFDFIYFSPSLKKILGYEEQELLGLNLKKLLSDKSYQEASTLFNEELLNNDNSDDTGTTVMLELESFHKSGTLVIMEVTISLMLTTNGEVEGVMMVGRDVTKRKEAESALLDSERRYRSVFENSGNAIITVDVHNTIISANSGFHVLSGYLPEEVEGQVKWTNFIAKDDYRRLKKEVWKKNRLLRSEKKEYNLIFIDRYDEEKNVLLVVAPIQDTGRWVVSFMDYTQLKKTEEAFRRSESNYKDLITNASDIIVTIDTRGYLMFANKAFSELSGYKEEEITKLHFSKLIHPDDYNLLAERFVLRVRGKEAHNSIEFKVVMKNGDVRIANMTSSSIIENGKIIGIQSILRDVTENRQLSEKIHLAKKHFEQIINSMEDSICVLNEDFEVVTANKMFSEKVKLDIHAIEGSSCGKVLSRYEGDIFYRNCKREDCQKYCRITQIFNNQENTFFIEKSVSKAKRVKYHKISIFHNRQAASGKSEVVLVIRDITKRKLAEESILKLNALNKSIMDNIPVSIITFDRRGIIISSNKYILDTVKEKSSIGDSFFKSILINKPDLIKNFKKLLKNGSSFTIDNYKILKPKGEFIYINIIAVPLRNKQQKIIGGVSMAWDNTDAKISKEKIELLNEKLEKKVIQRTWQLDEANKELARVLELKSKFISDASHELRTPLTIMQGNLDLAIHSAKANGGDIGEEFQIIYKEVQRMTGILSDLTILTNADSRKENLEYEFVYPGVLVKNTVDALQILARQKNIQLKIKNRSFSKDLFIRGDEAKLEKLLLNIVRNSIKYTEANGWVRLSLRQGKNGIEIRVEDNGIGIPAQDLPYIFERFYRVDKARSRQEGGTGLGLSISKWIVEAHCGKIGVESTEGVGTCFSVLLPYDFKKGCIDGELL